jgi:poly-gamma-glutamate synthesis protein (capsule biosynthesis protein)
MFGFEPDPAYYLAPFHPQAVNAMLGRVRVHEDGSMTCGIVPVYVEPPGRPTLAHGEAAVRIANYVSDITTQAGLPPLIPGEIGQDGIWLH